MKNQKIPIAPPPPPVDENPQDPTMPESFRTYLKSLSKKEADLFWQWVDGHPHIEDEIIETLAESHPDLAKENYNWNADLVCEEDSEKV